MNGFELTSALVGTLIWPLVVVAIVVCWRKSLTALFARIASTATSVSVAGFSVELESQLEQLGVSGLSLSPDGSIDAEHAANVREPVPLSVDPVATIVDSYECVRFFAVKTLEDLYGQLRTTTVPPGTDHALTELYGPGGFGTPTLAEAMQQYERKRGHVDEALARVTSELQSINDAVVSIGQPLSAFSPKERVYATHYRAVADRVIEHFRLLAVTPDSDPVPSTQRRER